jgi:NAD(P)-dependent dehydrogenase (short-subunit alcohol dehydrogenase family)
MALSTKAPAYSDFFQGKVALVTGAASGIGKAAALMFAENGAAVVVSDIHEDQGSKVVKEMESAGGKAFFVRADVSKAEDCEQLVAESLKKYGRLDIACNNAGIGGALGSTGDYPVQDWNQVIQTNLSGVFYCMRYQIPAMLKTGGGSITNISSILGQVGFAGAPAYTAAKHGVVGLTRASACEYATQGIRVNAIGPGFIETPMIAPVVGDPNAKKGIEGLHAMNRLGKAEEVADLILYLSSNRASFITGNYYAVDGGYLAR